MREFIAGFAGIRRMREFIAGFAGIRRIHRIRCQQLQDGTSPTHAQDGQDDVSLNKLPQMFEIPDSTISNAGGSLMAKSLVILPPAAICGATSF